MKRFFTLLTALALMLSLAACSSGGRTVTAGGVSVAFSESVGEFHASAFDSLPAAVTVAPGDAVTATFEYEPEAVIVSYFPAEGHDGELTSSLDAYRITFRAPDVTGECGINIGYTIDGTQYNLTFKLIIE